MKDIVNIVNKLVKKFLVTTLKCRDLALQVTLPYLLHGRKINSEQILLTLKTTKTIKTSDFWFEFYKTIVGKKIILNWIAI